MKNTVKPEQLADTFISVIQDWLTDKEMIQLREMNNSMENADLCASHEFCDPNQAMIDALEELGVSLDIQSESQLELINKAWNIAKENDFITRLQIMEDLGFPMLADWISEGEIKSLDEGLKHLEENKYMIDDEEDRKAFEKANEIVRSIFPR